MKEMMHTFNTTGYKNSRQASSRLALFGFMPNLALQLERSPLSHRGGYASAGESPICCASLVLNSKSFIQ
jgi:hypothetical protein